MPVIEKSVEERRLFQRFLSRFPARVQDANEGFGEKMFLRDSSADGVRLSSTERHYLDDNLTLEVSLPDSKQPLVLRGRVVWSRSKDQEHWDIGLKFHRPQLMRLSRLYEVTHPQFKNQ